MSYPPSGPNVPPPPGGPFGQQPGPYGQQGPGQPGSGYPGQPGFPGQGGPPPKKGSNTGLIAAIVGVIVLVVLVCCVGALVFLYDGDGGDPTDDTMTSETTESTTETTSETTSETTEPTSETTSEPTSETTTSAPIESDVDFPDSFDGWKRMTSSGTALATYRKGSDFLTALSTDTDLMSGYENAWGEVTKIGDISCGTTTGSSRYQCAGMKGGSTILVSSSYSTAKETADALKALRDAM